MDLALSLCMTRPFRSAVISFFACLLAAAAPSWASGEAVRVEFLRPAGGTPVFDQVDVEARIESEQPIEKVELRFDGAVVGRKTEPPWQWSLDVGSRNRARVFYVDVFVESGLSYRAEHLAPRFEADEEINLDLRQLYATVTNGHGERVLGLSRDDFAIVDDSEIQELVTFEGGDVPFTAVLLVDGSQSVQRNAFDVVLRGARRFVQNLKQHDEVKIIFFGDRVTGSTRWSGLNDDFDARIESLSHELEPLGGSALLDHLYLALLRAETRQGRRVVILLTDGWELHSVLSADQVEEAARRSQAQIFIVRRSRLVVNRLQLAGPGRAAPIGSLRDAKRTRRDFLRLQEIAEATGGRVLDIDGVDEVEGALQEILTELREQYALGYYPSNRRRDGSWHEVRIDVDARGLDVRSRGVYVDE